MKKFVLRTALAALFLPAVLACTEEPRNTEPLVDPWLRERTPVGLRLESQIGAAIISSDWRNDAEGNVVVTLVTGGLDLSAVKVVSLDFAYPDSEYCPSASIRPGDTVDLSSGSTSFVVTAYNGETRTYHLSYEPFVDAIAGVYTFETHCCWVYGGNMASWGGTHIMSFDDKSWNFPNYNYGWEDDNVLTLVCTGADAETGDTYGTVYHDAGPDGKFASFATSSWGNLSHFYRCIPEGEGTYFKNAATGEITFQGSYVDENGETVAIEKTCTIWPEGEHGPLAEIYADDLEHGGTDAKVLSIPAGACAFAFKIPADTPGLVIKNDTAWNDIDKFVYFPKYFFVLARKQ